jgi:hypothetical protein
MCPDGVTLRHYDMKHVLPSTLVGVGCTWAPPRFTGATAVITDGQVVPCLRSSCTVGRFAAVCAMNLLGTHALMSPWSDSTGLVQLLV